MFKKIVRSTGLLAGISLCLSSTVAAAAPVSASRAQLAPMSISPFLALSAYGTMQSRSAVCAMAVGAAGVAAAAKGQAPAQGCVLPIAEPVAPAVVETAPVAPMVSSGSGFGIGYLLAGLAVVAGLAAVLIAGGGDDDSSSVSPD